MRKVKGDAVITKRQIMEAAFDCFYNKGFDSTTLEEVAKNANLTRGAVYWHFKDKVDLYRQVVYDSYRYTDIVTFGKSLSEELSLKDRLLEIFMFVQSEYRQFMFIYKTIAFVSQSSDFADLMEDMRRKKIDLLNYFTNLAENYKSELRDPRRSASDIGSALFLMFEGLFLVENLSLKMPMSRKDIARYIELIIS